MQTRSSDENSVCPSVRPSVCPSLKHVLCDKMEERSVQIFRRSFSLVFLEEEWLVGVTPSTWNFESTGPVGAKSPIFDRYSPVAPQPVNKDYHQ